MARENFPMNFTCSADLTMEYSLFWYQNGSKIESDPTARIIITQSVSNNNSSITVSTLYISNMNESGEYRCTEENSLGEKQRDSLVTIKLFTGCVFNTISLPLTSGFNPDKLLTDDS